VTSTSQEIRARIVHDTLLPFVEGAKELSLDDCKGIIGVTFGSVMGYVHDRATRELFERALGKAASFTSAGEDLCKVAAHTLGREKFALTKLTTEAKAELLAYVSKLLKSLVSHLPKVPNYVLPTAASSLQASSPSMPSLPALVKHFVALVHSLALGKGTNSVINACKQCPILLEYVCSAVCCSEGSESLQFMPLAVLLYPLVLKAGPPASDVPKALLTVVATAVVHTKTSADWALWKAVSQAEAFWSHITAAEYEAVLLPSITQALKKSSHSTIPAVANIFSGLGPRVLTAANTKDLLHTLALGLSEKDISAWGQAGLRAACTNTQDAELTKAAFIEVLKGYEGCKEIVHQVSYLNVMKTVIAEGLEEGVDQSVRECLRTLFQANMFATLKPVVSSAPAEVRLAGYKVLLEVAIKASLVPDYIGAVAKDLVKVEDDAVRRMGLRVASRAALIDVKKVEAAAPAIKTLVADSEKKVAMRPDAVLGSIVLLKTKSLSKTDAWFSKGFLGRDPFLLSAEAMDRMGEGPEHLLGVVTVLEALLPPIPCLSKDLFDPMSQAGPLLNCLLLLATSVHRDVRAAAQRVVLAILEQAKAKDVQMLYTAWKDCFAPMEEEAPAKPDPKATGKPVPPAKGQKAAKPVAKPAASTSAGPKPTSAIRPGQVFPTSTPAVRNMYVRIVSAMLDGGATGVSKKAIVECFLLCGHPSNSGSVEDYWHIGCGKYDKQPQNKAFSDLFGAPSVQGSDTPPKVAAALQRRKLLEDQVEVVQTEVLQFLHHQQTEFHVAATCGIAYLVEVYGKDMLQKLLEHKEGLVACLEPTAVFFQGDLDCQVYNAGRYGLADLVEKAVEQELGGSLAEKQHNLKSTYGTEDEKWEAELMRKKAIEAGKDELSKKKDTLRQELTDKYMAILQRMRPEVYRVKCGLHALKCLVTDPGCHVHLQGFLSKLVETILPLLNSQLHEVISLGRNVLERLLSISDLAPLSLKLSTLITRLVADKHDDSRTEEDDDGLLTDRTMPQLRLACQAGALSAASFSLMFPILKAVLTKEKLVPPKRTWIKAASSAAAPGAAAPAAAATQIMAATPSNMQALPTKGQDMQMLPPKGMQMLPGKGKEMQMLPPKGMQALPGKGKDMQMLPSKKDGKSGKGGGKGGKDDKKIFVIPKPAAAAPAPATPASPATPTPVAPVVLPPHLQSAKPETMKLECSFHPVTQQLALSLLHNHCGLIDLQNRKQVLEVLVRVLETLPSLYRSTVHALNSIAVNLVSSDIGPLLRALYNGSALIKEAALGAFKHYQFFMRMGQETEGLEEEEEGAPKGALVASDEVDSAEHEELKLMLWVLQHDTECDGTAVAAKQLAEKAELTVPEGYCKTLVPLLLHEEDTIRTAAAAALSGALKQHPDSMGPVLEEIFSEHEKNMLGSSAGVERLGIACAIQALKDNYRAKDLGPVFGFLCAKALADFRDDVRSAVVNVGQVLIGTWGNQSHPDILPVLKQYLDKPPVGGDTKDLYTSGIIVWMGSIGVFSANKKDLLPIVDKLFAALATPSEAVQRSVCECLGTLLAMPALHPQHEKLTNQCLKKLIQPSAQQSTFAQKKGAAFGLAGIVKAARLPLIKKMGIMQSVRDTSTAKQFAVREGGLIALEIMCEVLGPLFEPYFVPIIDIVLAGFGDQNNDVKMAASDASKALMKSMSDHGVRQVLPILLEFLDDSNWRTKCTAIELLGSMAYCSAKQLAACLPSIIPKLISCLADSHAKVSATAFASLRRVGGVVQNQEIAHHVEVLLKALENPSAETDNALEALLFTRFCTSVDAPALALIYPILYRGLRERVTSTKMKAAQIIGSLSQLLTDPNVMVPYLKELVPQLKVALVDPIPEVRATSSKAVGALVKGMGESRFHSLIPWLMESLKTEGAGVERAGAAQALCEVIGALGVGRLETLLPDILANCMHPKAHVREGYIQLFVFLPHALAQQFQPYLQRVLPRVLDGLADEAEIVRTVSLRSGQIIVKNYGQQCLGLLLPKLEDGLFSDNWRIRHSSLLLIGDLLMRVATAAMPKKGKVKTKAQLAEEAEDAEEEEEEEDEDKEGEEGEGEDADFLSQGGGMSLQDMKRMRSDRTANSIVETLRNLVGDPIEKILAVIYMIRSDVQVMVRSEANTVWKALVDNTPALLRRILPRLTRMLQASLASGECDRRQVAGRALGDLVGKLGEAVLPTLIPELQNGLESDEVAVRHGVTLGFTELLQAASRSQLQGHADALVPAILKGICDEDEAVRETAAYAFDQLFKGVGGNCVEDVVMQLVRKLESDDEDVKETGLSGLTQIIAVRPKVVLGLIIPKMCKQDLFSETYARALTQIANVSGDVMTFYIPQLLPVLVVSMGHDLDYMEHVKAATISLISILDDESLPMAVSEIKTSIQSANAAVRRGGAALVGCMCGNIDEDVDFEETIPTLIQNTVRLFDDKEESVRVEAVSAMKAITDSLSKEDQLELLSTVHSAIMVSATSVGVGGAKKIAAFAKPKALDPVLPYYIKTFTSGTPEAKEIAARGLGELIELTPSDQLGKYIPTMIGPLLRIINEKMPPTSRQAILQTLCLIIENGGIMLKAFLPQLQSTYVKAINDDQSGTRVDGLKGLRMLLNKHEPRVDSILSELNNQLKTQRIPNIMAALMRGITLLLVKKGAKVSETVASTVAGNIASLCISEERHFRIAAGKCIRALSSVTSSDFDEAVEEVLEEISSGKKPTGLSGVAGLLQVCAQKLSSGHVSQLVGACLPTLKMDDPDCLLALRALQKAAEFHPESMPFDVAQKCSKFTNVILNDASQHGTRLDRVALAMLASLAKNMPKALSADIGKIIAGLLQKVTAKGDPTYSAKLSTCFHHIQENCDLVALKVPKVHITNIKQHAADQAAKAAEETELEEEQALYDYENR